jgi:hypothetical protein
VSPAYVSPWVVNPILVTGHPKIEKGVRNFEFLKFPWVDKRLKMNPESPEIWMGKG